MLRGCRNINVLREKASFFRELASLGEGVRLNSASVVDVGSHLTGRFREPAVGLGKELTEGKTLVDAMSAFPEWFDEYDLFIARKLEADSSENAGETIAALARSAELEYLRLSDLRRMFFAPMGLFCVLWLFAFVFFYVIVWEFKHIYETLLEGEPLPGLTHLIMDIAVLTHTPMLSMLFLVVPFGLLLAFYVTDRNFAVFGSLCQFLKVFHRRDHEAELFRIFTAFSVGYDSDLTLTETFVLVSSVVRDEQLQDAIANASMGTDDLAECAKEMTMHSNIPAELSRGLSETVRTKDSSVLWNLGVSHGEKANYRLNWLVNTVCIVIVMGFVFLAGLVVLGLFLPLFYSHEQL